MSATKQDYTAISRIIRHQVDNARSFNQADAIRQLHTVAHNISLHFCANPRFDPVAFKADCGFGE